MPAETAATPEGYHGRSFKSYPMAVVPFTIAISLMLVTTFIAFFLIERRGARQSSAEHDSLLPLAEERPRVAGAPADAHDA
jgi:hypothetical protein